MSLPKLRPKIGLTSAIAAPSEAGELGGAIVVSPGSGFPKIAVGTSGAIVSIAV